MWHGRYIMTDDLSHLCDFARSIHFESMARSLVLIVGFNLMVWRLNTVLGSHRTRNSISRNMNLIRFQGFRNDGPAIPTNIPMYSSVMYPGILLLNPNTKCSVFLKIFWLPILGQTFGNSVLPKQVGYRRPSSGRDKIIEADDEVSNSDSRLSAYRTNDTSKLNDKHNDDNQSNDVDDLEVEKKTIEYGGRRIFSDNSRHDDDNKDDDLTFQSNRKYMDLDSDDDKDVINYRRYYSRPNGPYLSSYNPDDNEEIDSRGH